jgi:hypothetical protein
MKRIKITVTATDIRKAKKLVLVKAAAYSCPIALAAQRTLKDEQARVFMDEIKLCIENGQRLRLPLKAQRFISRFDDNKPVKPFSFTVLKP